MVLQTSSRTTRQHRKKSSPEKSGVGTDYSRAEGNSRLRALSSKSLDLRAILSGTLGTQFATPCDCRSVRGGIGWHRMREAKFGARLILLDQTRPSFRRIGP